jgi:hypothetical protein
VGERPSGNSPRPAYSNGGISGLFQRCRWAIYAHHSGFSIIYSIEIGRICSFLSVFLFLIEFRRFFCCFFFDRFLPVLCTCTTVLLLYIVHGVYSCTRDAGFCTRDAGAELDPGTTRDAGAELDPGANSIPGLPGMLEPNSIRVFRNVYSALFCLAPFCTTTLI